MNLCRPVAQLSSRAQCRELELAQRAWAQPQPNGDAERTAGVAWQHLSRAALYEATSSQRGGRVFETAIVRMAESLRSLRKSCGIAVQMTAAARRESRATVDLVHGEQSLL